MINFSMIIARGGFSTVSDAAAGTSTGSSSTLRVSVATGTVESEAMVVSGPVSAAAIETCDSSTSGTAAAMAAAAGTMEASTAITAGANVTTAGTVASTAVVAAVIGAVVAAAGTLA